MGALYNKLETEKEGAVCMEADVAVRLLGKLTQFHRVVRHTPQARPPPHLSSKIR